MESEHHSKRNSKTGRFAKRHSGKSMVTTLMEEIPYEPPDIGPSDDGIKWCDGRRIIELKILADALGECSANNCKQLLDLRKIIREQKVGLASVLWVQCECGEINRVKTGKCHKQSDKHGVVYDVNTKCAEGMLHAGLSQTAVQRFLATLEVPPPARSTLKIREREVGPVIERVAEETCKKALELESCLTETDSTEGAVNLTASYDMGWQRRSSGRAYNSRSGHGVMIGKESGKILAYGSRIVNCKQCEVDTAKGESTTHHCRVNWDGSSKAMEADLAVELIEKTNNSEHRISTIIGDEDATTMSKVKNCISYDVKKLSDNNHIKKTIGNCLYNLQKSHKVLQSRVISYIQRCFVFALGQNKGDPIGTGKAIENIVPHVFGVHGGCDDTWCKFKQDATHEYTDLPHGKCLQGDDLREALSRLFSSLAANSEKLCYNSSSNANESFNNMVAAKAPKYCHYSKSESLDFRISATVCQKNVGENYLNMINAEIGLSPGKVSMEVSEQRDHQFLKRKEREASIESKRKRIQLKAKRNKSITQKEVREGTTYKPSVCLDSIDNIQLVPIPKSTSPPPIETVETATFDIATCCIFDLETTSLYNNCDIVQISAVTLDGLQSFDKYILPDTDICAAASRVHGLTKKGNKLFLHGKLVPTVNVADALIMFAEWLTAFNHEIILIGHNIKAFDIKHLLRNIRERNMGLGFHTIVGYVDTLPLMKTLLPHETSHSQSNIYRRVIGKEYNAHNSLADVHALAEILRTLDIGHELLSRYSMNSSWADKYFQFLEEKKKNIESLQALVQGGILSKNMVDKAAGSGLRYEHMMVVFRRDGDEGIYSLFSEECNGKPRVTKNKKIIASVIQYFNSL